mmetsp:Transcript_101339/g.321875  ORF Transcript_101339/g.321875 Transcript_101339/m.321875 type:complete len:385 (+) Transcript_101339:615-1769(+)
MPNREPSPPTAARMMSLSPSSSGPAYRSAFPCNVTTARTKSRSWRRGAGANLSALLSPPCTAANTTLRSAQASSGQSTKRILPLRNAANIWSRSTSAAMRTREMSTKSKTASSPDSGSCWRTKRRTAAPMASVSCKGRLPSNSCCWHSGVPSLLQMAHFKSATLSSLPTSTTQRTLLVRPPTTRTWIACCSNSGPGTIASTSTLDGGGSASLDGASCNGPRGCSNCLAGSASQYSHAPCNSFSSLGVRCMAQCDATTPFRDASKPYLGSTLACTSKQTSCLALCWSRGLSPAAHQAFQSLSWNVRVLYLARRSRCRARQRSSGRSSGLTGTAACTAEPAPGIAPIGHSACKLGLASHSSRARFLATSGSAAWQSMASLHKPTPR